VYNASLVTVLSSHFGDEALMLVMIKVSHKVFVVTTSNRHRFWIRRNRLLGYCNLYQNTAWFISNNLYSTSIFAVSLWCRPGPRSDCLQSTDRDFAFRMLFNNCKYKWFIWFYRAMLRREQLCHDNLSVRPSLRLSVCL